MSKKMTRRHALVIVASAVAMPMIASPRSARSEASETPFMKVDFTFNRHSFAATLVDSPSARDLAAMLPLNLEIDDYSTNEKIAYLPRKLTEAGSGPFADEAPGDLAYYAPWGNLVFYHAAYRYSPGLIRLGRLEGGVGPLLVRGRFPMTATARR